MMHGQQNVKNFSV